MPLTLRSRIGQDTVAKLERAATRRFVEARHLEPDEPLGAIYLYGYVIETRLKGAYYRLAGVPLHADLNVPLPGSAFSPRKTAELDIKTLLGPGATGAVGHHLTGWATLLITRRAATSAGPYAIVFRDALLDHVKNAALCWTEVLRYRANKPYDEERKVVAEAAGWLRRNYRRLWT
jgi:hypothetical protein